MNTVNVCGECGGTLNNVEFGVCDGIHICEDCGIHEGPTEEILADDWENEVPLEQAIKNIDKAIEDEKL